MLVTFVVYCVANPRSHNFSQKVYASMLLIEFYRKFIHIVWFLKYACVLNKNTKPFKFHAFHWVIPIVYLPITGLPNQLKWTVMVVPDRVLSFLLRDQLIIRIRQDVNANIYTCNMISLFMRKQFWKAYTFYYFYMHFSQGLKNAQSMYILFLSISF